MTLLGWPLDAAPAPLVVLAIFVFGGRYQRLAALDNEGLPAAVLVLVVRALVNVYFPSFIVAGSVSPVFALFGLYLIFAIVFATRRRWGLAAIVLLLPIALGWWFSYAFLRD